MRKLKRMFKTLLAVLWVLITFGGLIYFILNFWLYLLISSVLYASLTGIIIHFFSRELVEQEAEYDYFGGKS